MRIYQITVLSLCLMLALVACDSGGDAEDTLPTRGQVDEENSDTVDDEAVDPTPTAESLESQSSGPPTLPPSWTPEPTNTLIPQPTRFETMPPPTVRPACQEFRIDREQSSDEITLGENPILAWTQVPGAGSYRVRLFDESGVPITDDPPIAVENVYTLSGEYFTMPGRYGWEVQPLDAAGIQMCTGLGDLLIISE